MNSIEYIKHWIITELSQPYDALNGLSICPFANPALQANKIKFVRTTKKDFLRTNTFDNRYDATVFVFSNNILPETLYNLANQFNKNNKDYIALEDHPKEPEVINDIVFNNGKYPIIIVQTREKLTKFRAVLDKKGYYKNWSKQDLDDVMHR